MPTYEYECPKCGHKFEQFQLMSAPLLSSCPCCKAKPKRLIGAGAGIIFKGSGFYATDYRSPSYTERAKKENAAAVPAPEPKKEKKAEGKVSSAEGKGSSSD